MKKRWLGILLTGVMAVSMLSVPAMAEEASSSASTEEEAALDFSGDISEMKLGISWNFMINESATETKAFLDEYAEKYGFTIVHLVADGDSAQQITDVKDLISQECDVIGVVPVDSATSDTMCKEVQGAGIKYVNFNRPYTGNETPDASVVPDSEQQAYDAAISCLEQMTAAGVEEVRVLDIIGSLTDENAVNRDTGLKAAIEDYKAENGTDIEIVQELECDWDNEWITANLPAAVTAHPEANMLFIPSDYCAAAVASSLETASRWFTRDEEGHMWIASQDVYIDGYEFMVDGYFDSDALLSNSLVAEGVVEAAGKLYLGESYGDAWDIAVECPLYTPDNCETEEMISYLSYKDEL